MDDFSAEKEITNLQSPRSSRRQCSLNISSIRGYIQESIDCIATFNSLIIILVLQSYY